MFIHIFFSLYHHFYIQKKISIFALNKQQTRFANENENGDLQI